MKTNVSISKGCYGKNKDNFTCINIGNITLYFSYETIIAFATPESGLIVSKNEWGTTTGKHLNYICPDHKKRVEFQEFSELFDKYVGSKFII